MQEPLLTPQEVAKALNMKTSSMATWRVKGIGPKFLKCGKSIRYRPEDVDSWLANQERNNTAQR